MDDHSARKTRVLILGPELGAVSGVSTHLNQLLGSALGCEVDFRHFTVGSEGRRESGIGKLLRLLISPLSLAMCIIKDRPDIVHINVSLDHKSFPRDALYLAVSRVLHRKVVLQVHGGELPRNFYSSPQLRDQFVRRVLYSANVVVLLAQSELAAYSEFVPGQRLEVIPNGTAIDQQAAPPESPTTRPLRLAYVGRFVPTKGVTECIAAATLLREAGRDFTLTIAGAGPQEEELRAAAESLVRQGKVVFAGQLVGEAKEHLWRDSDVFVFPTSHQEGLPYAVLESMAAGAVPITTTAGALPDVIECGVHGLFVPPGNPEALFKAIAALDDDRQLLFSMSRQAMIRARANYSIERLSAAFGDLYRSL